MRCCAAADCVAAALIAGAGVPPTVAVEDDAPATVTPFAPVVDADGNVDVPAKNVLAAPTACGLLEAAEMLERAGLGLGKSETYRVALAVKTLADDDAEKLSSCKFWGKIYGTKADYLVAEGTTGERGAFAFSSFSFLSSVARRYPLYGSVGGACGQVAGPAARRR